MDQRLQFVSDAFGDRFTMTDLCARYGVSRMCPERNADLPHAFAWRVSSRQEDRR
jgi:hypothetical protein